MRKTTPTKWVVITGGVLSGLGKGIVASSIGALLKSQGLQVQAIKIDPYINIDAGTMRPTVHGEVFVTYDGGETDQDLGNYERFLQTKISRKNNITTGQIYQEVIRRERNLEYGGSDVEVTKHVPDEIKRRLEEAATGSDIQLLEIGGTVGDYQNIIFLEAVRQMKQEGHNIQFVHVSYLPMLGSVGELKTKPTQHSVRALNSVGIFADYIVARASIPVDQPRKEKISVFCNVHTDDVISAPDVKSIYTIPARFDQQGFGRKICERFGYTWKNTAALKRWHDFAHDIEHLTTSVRIGIVGKYFDIGDCTLEDSYISVIEAIKAGGFAHHVRTEIVWINSKEFEEDQSSLRMLDTVDAVIVPGGFGASGVEGKINAIQYCREHNIPFLGLCYGLQLAVIEWARNVIGLHDAHTVEIIPHTPHPVIALLPKQAELLAKKQYGNSMRLGEYSAKLRAESKVAKLYGSLDVVERHRHRYEVNPAYCEQLETQGMVFSGKSPDGILVEFLELNTHPFFIATQAHPEFTSRPDAAHPLFAGLVKAALHKSQ